jgi:hypothetical protein
MLRERLIEAAELADRYNSQCGRICLRITAQGLEIQGRHFRRDRHFRECAYWTHLEGMSFNVATRLIEEIAHILELQPVDG